MMKEQLAAAAALATTSMFGPSVWADAKPTEKVAALELLINPILIP